MNRQVLWKAAVLTIVLKSPRTEHASPSPLYRRLIVCLQVASRAAAMAEVETTIKFLKEELLY
jgi:hypothetical protein